MSTSQTAPIAMLPHYYEEMKYICVCQHLGLGDHIICNGLVRELIDRESADVAYLPVVHHNINSVSQMFGDDRRIMCLPVSGVGEVQSLSQLIGNCVKVFRVGYEKTRSDWDISFYDSVNVPFDKRWTSFKCNRDGAREAKLYSMVNPACEPFILVHDTSSVCVCPFETRSDIKVIRVAPIETRDGWTSSLIDWCGLIDSAVEIHCIDSSFIHLCASMGKVGVFHDFNRSASWGGKFVLPPTWRVIKERSV